MRADTFAFVAAVVLVRVGAETTAPPRGDTVPPLRSRAVPAVALVAREIVAPTGAVVFCRVTVAAVVTGAVAVRRDAARAMSAASSANAPVTHSGARNANKSRLIPFILLYKEMLAKL